MGLDSSPEMGSKGEMQLMKPDNKSGFHMINGEIAKMT